MRDEAPRTGGITATGIIGELESPVDLGSVHHQLRTSIGIVVADGVQSPDELLSHAEQAMYRSKAARRSTWTVFAPEPKSQPTIPDNVDSSAFPRD